MKFTIQKDNSLDDLLQDSRHQISKTFLREARSKDQALIDENVVIFSHQAASTVAAPFRIDKELSNRSQSLISLYLHGGTGYDLRNGYYTIQGSFDKNGIREKNLLLLDSNGKIVQELTVDNGADSGSGDQVIHQKNLIEITDAHTKVIFGKFVRVDISGTFKDKPFVVHIYALLKPNATGGTNGK